MVTHRMSRVSGVAAGVGLGVAIWLGTPTASADDSPAGTSSASSHESTHSRSSREDRRAYVKRATGNRSVAENGRGERRSRGRHADGRSVSDPEPRASTPVLMSFRGTPPAPSVTQPATTDRNGPAFSPVDGIVAAATRRELTATAPARVDVVARLSRTGHQTTTAEFNADGSRAIITTTGFRLFTGKTYTRTTVIDTATGLPVRNTLPLSGVRSPSIVATAVGGGSSFITPDGSRALDISGIIDETTNVRTTQVTVTDTATGTPIGGTVTLAGEMWPPTVYFGADGTRAMISTSAYDPRNGTPHMLVTAIDTTTGSKVGTTLVLTGFMLASPVFSADRSRLIFTSYGRDGDTGADVTDVGIIDTTSGDQVGATLSFTRRNDSTYVPIFSADGKRVLIQSDASDPPARFATQIAVVDTTTGQATNTFTFSGINDGVVLSPDGRHVLTVGYTINWLSLSSTSRVTLLRIS